MAESEVNGQVTVPVENNSSNDALLIEMRELAKKQLLWQKISAICSAGILAVAVIAACILIPMASITLNHINATATKAQATLDSVNATAVKAQASLDDVDIMVAEMTDASKNLNELIDNNENSLQDAIERMANVDYDGLNQAIKDLQGAVGPLANFFGKFR